MSTSSIPRKSVARSNGRRTHKKRWLWVAVAGLLLLLFASGWALSIRAAAKSIKADAAIAQTQLSQSKAALTAGNLTAAAAAAALAEREVSAARHIAESLSVRALGLVPYFGGVVSDLNHLISAAQNAAAADAIVVKLYGKVSGKADGAGLFAHKRIDFVELSRAGTQVAQIDDLLNAAVADLLAVKATIPGTRSLSHARDSALAEIIPLERTIGRLRTVWPSLADAFGANGPRNYLLALENPAELFPGGGAALAAVIIRFDHGVMTTPVKGSVSSSLFPNNPLVRWAHVVGMPYFAKEYSPASFAWSGEHPDFKLSAIELLRAWQAHTGLLPDGVIAIDPVALAAALRATGPIQSAVYGTITSSNLVQQLLIQGYQTYGQNRDGRHEVNQLLLNAMLERLSGGHGLLNMVVQMSSTAPARHLRVYMSDPLLQQAIIETGWSGYMTRTSGDLVDAFSLDQNANKVSVFQQRQIAEHVALRSDGSATVTRVITVTNGAPSIGFNPADRIGLTTRWAYNHYDIFLPASAQLLAHSATLPRGGFSTWRDVGGWVIVRMSYWLAPGQTLRLTVVFTLPAGTFSQGSGPPRYYFVAEPQPMITVAKLTVTVEAPAGRSFSPGTGWSLAGSTAIFSAGVDRTVSSGISLTPSK